MTIIIIDYNIGHNALDFLYDTFDSENEFGTLGLHRKYYTVSQLMTKKISIFLALHV